MNYNVTYVSFGALRKITGPALQWQYNEKQLLVIKGLNLPENYEVDFSNKGDAETVTMPATENGVEIPDKFLLDGRPIIAYVVVADGDSVNTVGEIMFPVNVRGRRTDISPEPAQKQQIDELVDLLNQGVVKAIPAGGNEGQILAKASDSDYDTEWIDNTGGGGTGNYNELINKPSINGIELNGDKSLSELGIASESDIPTIPVESVNGKTGKVVLTPLDVGAYEKPASGIPKTDLAADVKNSLNKADTALQSAPVTSVNGKTGSVEIEIPNINPDSKTSEMTKSVGVDSDGKLWTTPDNQSGTSDYSELENKPKINNVELSGNKTASDLGLATPSDIPAVPVKSVNGKTGNVSINAGDIGFDAQSSYSENTVGERIAKFNELMEILDDNFIPFPYSNTDKEAYGIKWTVNSDGSITANGTATRNTTFLVAAWTIEQGSIPINPEFEYVLSGSPQGASDSTYFVGARYYAEGVTPSSTAGKLLRDRGEGALVKNGAYISIYCSVMKGVTVDNIQFKPKLSYAYGELSPADFYKNGEGIIGSDEIKFLQRSALLDKAIVSPSKYGAAGNGLTDDTDAIQQCFDENPNAIIIFERGDYLIKNELSLYGNQGGQVVIFGGANIIWGGEVEPDLAMVSVNKVDYSESRTLIIGGMFWGNDRIGTGIKSVKFHTTISDCKIVDVTKEGIAIGSLTDRDSLQNVVRNCMVMMSRKSTQGWSDENNVTGLSLYAPDGFVSGLNVNRCKVGAYLMGINYVFVNCHFTTQYREQKATMADTYGVLLDPSSTGKIGTHMFENVYFDNAKYVIYAGKQNKISVDISNSFYFNSGNQTTDIVDAFMVGGYPVNVHVNHFTVISAAKKCRFFDATFCNGITMKEMDMITQKYDRTWYELLQGVPYVASNLCNPGESACFIYDREIEANKMVEVGCVLVNGSDPSLSGGMTFHYRNGTHGEALFSVKYSTENSKLIVSNKQVVASESGMWFAISLGETLSLNGSTKTMFKIYYGSDNGITNAQATISCDYASPNQFYVDPNDGEIINADGLSNYTIIDIN